MFHRPRISRFATALPLVLSLMGCSSFQSDYGNSFGSSLGDSGIRMTEQHLLDAGFKIMVADTQEKLKMLNTLPAETVTSLPHDGRTWYVYPDPKICSCLYVGRDVEFQHLQRLGAEQRISNQYLVAHELSEDYQSGWGPQGAFGNFNNIIGGNNPMGHPDWDPQ